MLKLQPARLHCFQTAIVLYGNEGSGESEAGKEMVSLYYLRMELFP